MFNEEYISSINFICYGENGAGKSTLMNILAGLYKPSSGKIIMSNKKCVFNSPKDAINSGISMVHQELHLCDELTVAENIFAGRYPVKKSGIIDWKELFRSTQEILNMLDIHIKPKDIVGSLSIANKQMVEIAKAMSLNASVIIFDEPTSSITDSEKEVLFNNIRKMKNNGIAIVYISHRMDEIFEIADEVSVMRDGELIETIEVKNATIDRLIADMIGRDVHYVEYQSSAQDKVVLEVKNLTRYGVFENISFNVHKGEVVSLAGLVGAGRTEVARCIFGLDKFDKGEILIDGKPIRHCNPKKAINAGLGFVTEDRKEEGCVLDMSVANNVTLANLKSICNGVFLNKRCENDIAKNSINKLSIKTPSPFQTVKNLSGGNQQKVIIAKWLLHKLKLIILDEPTRGIDIGAKNEIYKIIKNLTAEGVAVLMISSELPEVLRMSDRIIVLREGKITGELHHDDASQDAIMRFAMGQ